MLLCALVIVTVRPTQAQQIDSFEDGEFTSNPTWSGDTGAWTIAANATLAQDRNLDVEPRTVSLDKRSDAVRSFAETLLDEVYTGSISCLGLATLRSRPEGFNRPFGSFC